MELHIDDLVYYGYYYSYEYAITQYKPKKYFYFYTNLSQHYTIDDFPDIKDKLEKNNNTLYIYNDNICQKYIFDKLEFYYYDDINNIFTLVGDI